MSGSYEVAGGKIVIAEGSRTVFDTSTRPPQLIPSARLELTGVQIEFPHLWSGTLYRQGRDSSGPFDVFSCLTCTAIIDQEWGPDKPAPLTLTDTVLGSVPAGVDYLDVRVRLSRTVSPSPIYNLPVEPMIPQNQWISAAGTGGAVVVELHGPLRRMFDVRLIGTNVVLRRRQSMSGIKSVPAVWTAWRTMNQGQSSLGNAIYYFEGVNAPYSNVPQENNNWEQPWYPAYSIGTVIDSKQSGGSNHRPARFGGQNPCSESHAAVSYRSVWTGDIVVTPGRVSP